MPFDRPHRVWVEEVDFKGNRVTVGFDGNSKLVETLVGKEDQTKSSAELYDLTADPTEDHPRVPPTDLTLRRDTEHHRAQPRPVHDLPPPVIDPERERRLRQLGYVQ